MKAILLSVQPKWLEKILNGEKTVEIRKTMPKCKLPIDVYLYCTKGMPLYICGHLTFGKKVFDDVETYKETDVKAQGYMGSVCEKPVYKLNGSIVAKFTLREVKEIGYIIEGVALDDNYEYSLNDDSTLSICDYLKQTGLTLYEALNYKGNKDDLYAWHISDLVVFDKPMELGEFGNYYEGSYEGWLSLNKPPQSWQYVEVGNE